LVAILFAAWITALTRGVAELGAIAWPPTSFARLTGAQVGSV